MASNLNENTIEIPKLSTNDQIDRVKPKQIQYLNSTECYSTFFLNHMLPNIPCIIRNINFQCAKQWTIGDNVNLHELSRTFGEAIVPVADCREKYYNAQQKCDLTMRQFLDYLREKDERLLYLKDWHCKRQFPDVQLYDVPKYFASDWLNEYALDTGQDDHMFVYIGPEHSWTPFHCDVFSSYSWSVNVFGRKKWLLYPPGEEDKLKDATGNLPYDCEQCDHENVERYEVIQEAGEAIFVPSNWHHQVYNERLTISINHNWINACNVLNTLQTLQMELLKVRRELDDCRDNDEWLMMCQTLLKATFGMDYKGFGEFLGHIARKRIDFLNSVGAGNEGKGVVLFGKWLLGREHARFDLLKILDTLREFRKCIDVDGLGLGVLIDELIVSIEVILKI